MSPQQYCFGQQSPKLCENPDTASGDGREVMSQRNKIPRSRYAVESGGGAGIMGEVPDREEKQQLRSIAKEFLRTLSKEDEKTVRTGLGEGKTQLEFERMV